MVMTKHFTALDLQLLPDDGQRHDLIRGELYSMPPAEEVHGEVGGRIAVFVGSHVLGNGLGNICVAEPGFYLARDPDVLVAPDVAFVRADRVRPKDERRGFVPFAPDLAVEVISPSESAKQVGDKIAAYLDAGTAELRVVRSLRRTVTVYEPGQEPRVLSMGDVLGGGDVLPGFALPVADIFE